MGLIPLALATCLIAAVWPPLGLDALLELRSIRSIALFSPVTGQFVFREYLTPRQEAALPAAEAGLAEHGLMHRDASGKAISRTDFENALPFQYAESLRVRGLLPITLQGREFDAEALRQGRLILGIRPAGWNFSTPTTTPRTRPCPRRSTPPWPVRPAPGPIQAACLDKNGQPV